MVIRKTDLTQYALDIGVWDALVALAGRVENEEDGPVYEEVEITQAIATVS